MEGISVGAWRAWGLRGAKGAWRAWRGPEGENNARWAGDIKAPASSPRSPRSAPALRPARPARPAHLAGGRSGRIHRDNVARCAFWLPQRRAAVRSVQRRPFKLFGREQGLSARWGRSRYSYIGCIGKYSQTIDLIPP